MATNVTAIAAGGSLQPVQEQRQPVGHGQQRRWPVGRRAPRMAAITTLNLPEQIVASNVTAIAAGRYHSLFRRRATAVSWVMGRQRRPASWVTALTTRPTGPKEICGYQRHGDCRGVACSPFLNSDGSHGLWLQRRWPVGAMALTTRRTGPIDCGHQRHGGR